MKHPPAARTASTTGRLTVAAIIVIAFSLVALSPGSEPGPRTFPHSLASTSPAGLPSPFPNGATAAVNSGPAPASSVASSRSAFSYNVTFTETGLPVGTPWAVELLTNCTSVFSSGVTTPSVVFSLANGSYAFSVNPPVPSIYGNYSASPPSGVISVIGGPANESIRFAPGSPSTFGVVFVEQGVPDGVAWGVILSGVDHWPRVQGMVGVLTVFLKVNGSYSFVAGSPTGFLAAPSSGTVLVSGFPSCQTITFTHRPAGSVYPVTFYESGLPSGNQWWVNVTAGMSATTVFDNLSFDEPNGTYAYTIAGTDPQYAAPSGTFWVNGSATTVGVGFIVLYFTVSFTETGLPTGSGWFASLDGARPGSHNATIAFPFERVGTHPFSIDGPVGYLPSPAAGDLMVTGANVSISVRFTAHFSVEFTETGLPNGTYWTVTLNGGTESSRSTSITFANLAAGSFNFSVSPVGGSEPSPGSGSVNSSPVIPAPVRVTFTSSSGPEPINWQYLAVGILAGVAIVGATFLVWSQRRPPGPRAASPPASHT